MASLTGTIVAQSHIRGEANKTDCMYVVAIDEGNGNEHGLPFQAGKDEFTLGDSIVITLKKATPKEPAIETPKKKGRKTK